MSTGSYVPKWLRATGGQGEIRVLAFTANRQADNYVGSLTEQETAELTGALDQLADNDAMLVVVRGNNHGATYLLDADITRAGRNPDNDIA